MHARISVLVAALAVSLWMVPISGQEAGGQTADTGVPVAPVVVDGDVLFSVRGLSAYTPEQRAAGIADGIRTIAADPAVDAASLALEERQGLTVITANGRPVMRILDEDAAIESVARPVLAQGYRNRIATAVEAYRAARQPAVLRQHALQAVGATFALLIAAFLFHRMMLWLRGLLERRYSSRVQDVSIQSFQILRAEQLWWTFRGILRIVWGVVVILMLFAYLRYVLALFPWTRGASGRLVALVVDPLQSLGQGFVATIPNLAFLAILYLITRYILRVIRLFFDSVDSGSVAMEGFEREWAVPTYRLVRLAIVALALVVAYPYVPGSGTEAFKGVTLFAGILFSLGSSSFIGNVIAGYSMTYRRAFRVGDRVKIGDHFGEVVEIRLLGTHLRTPRNEIVIVPNSEIVSTDVMNYSTVAARQGLILSATIAIGYGTPWRQVEAMLLEAAARTTGLMRDRQPFVHQTALGEFSVTYEINVFCDAPERMRMIYSELRRNILDVFNEYGVQIMTPAYEGQPETPLVVPKEHWFTDPAIAERAANVR